jgi:signal transduction histidine kinase
MYPWRQFFDQNQIIILFTYGQVFFLLGLAIAWQSRRHSRLDLARSLGWLGAFGLIHGLHEWGDIFIPIQAEYLSRAWVETLSMVQVCLLAFSFACLFQFGAETLRSLYPRMRAIQIVPAGLLIAWATAFLWSSQVTRGDAAQLIVYANIWARYLMALPGAALSGLALIQQTRHRVQAGHFVHMSRPFRVAGATLILYAVLGGLVVPAARFFPADLLNVDTVTDVLGVPPQVLRSVAGLVLVISIVRGLEIFEVEIDRRIEDIERSQILIAERERVSRELHDGAIQTVYTAGLIAESIRNKMDNDTLAKRMDRVISALQHAIQDLRQFVIELEPSQTGEGLVEGFHRLAQDPTFQSLIDMKISIDCDESEHFSPVRATHVLAITKEALANAARHAHARNVWVTATHLDGQLEVIVTDDGMGFPDEYRTGFGLRNMRDRARLLGGTLQIEPMSGQGTQITLSVPWDDP